MGKLYNFVRLIKKYSVTYELITTSEGGYVNGKYQKGISTVTEMYGAIVPLTERKIYQSGGNYSTKDRQLFSSVPITAPLKDTKVRYKGETYNVEEETNYSDYSDAYVYLLRWVSAVVRDSED